MIGHVTVPSSVFNLNNPGNYVADFTTEKVGNVSGRDYQYYEKGQDGEIVWLTCDEYIDKCIHDIFNSNWDSTVTYAVDQPKVHQYARKMLQGDTFPIPFLNYATKQQEGRHRAFAVKEAFGPDARFPVLEVYPSHPSLDAISDYTIRKCGGNVSRGMALLPEIAGRWYSQKEIYNYLGLDYQEDDPEQKSEADWSDIPNELDDDILLEEVAREAGIPVDKIDDLDAADFARMLQKVLNKY